jgi:hypothetical protein
MRSSTVGFSAAFVTLLFAACNVGDDTVAPNTAKDAGGGGLDSTTSDAPGSDSKVPTDPNSLCAKYGGFDPGVNKLVDDMLQGLKVDCQIGAFFTALSQADHLHLKNCLANQFGEIMGCGGVTYAGSVDAVGAPCRTMADAHQAVDPQIRQADFDAFYIDVTASLAADGVAAADITKIAPALKSVNGDVVQSNDPGLSNSTCDGGPVDGGGEGGEAGEAGPADTGVADAIDDGG